MIPFMGSLYAILAVLGAGFLGLAFVIWGLEGDKKERWMMAGGVAGFVIVAIALWYAVLAFLQGT